MSLNVDLYDIQKDFIANAIKCIENRKIGIFSSPTGTGKTLSLLLSIKPYIIKNNNCNFSGLSEKNIQILKSLNYEKTPIYYASRTHSQLNQAIKELKNLNFECNALVIGSRALYCKHDNIQKYSSIDQINESCKKYRQKDKCIYFHNMVYDEMNIQNSSIDMKIEMKANSDSFITKKKKLNSFFIKDSFQKENGQFINKNKKPNEFNNHGIHDIEDLKNNECGFCPYYKAKDLVRTASIVFLPYQMLFSKDSRESFKLQIKDAIIIIDEAHNIYESVIQLNSVTISYEQIKKYLSSFRKYKSKFEHDSQSIVNAQSRKFHSEKRTNILNTFIEIITLLNDFCEVQQKKSFKEENILFVNDFLIKSHLQNFNMLILKEYLKSTNIIQVLEGYERNLEFGLYSIVNFLVLLTNSDLNGIILYDSKKIRFTPLDAKLYFEEIHEFRSLILAGGTMEPLETILRIYPNACIYSYGSVCKNFTAHILPSSSSGKQLKLTYEKRESTRVMDDLAITVQNLIVCAKNAMNRQHKKGGIVCFVPSRNFLDHFRLIFTDKINLKINFYFENLDEFNNNCKIQSSVLFAVMGGRLSEGINFKDDFCRLLIIIGVPFPSSTPRVETTNSV